MSGGGIATSDAPEWRAARVAVRCYVRDAARLAWALGITEAEAREGMARAAAYRAREERAAAARLRRQEARR